MALITALSGSCAAGLPEGATPAAPAANKPLEFTGINLAGGEFGSVDEGKKRSYGVHFIFPPASGLDYFASKGLNIVRFPFRWEDLQPVLSQPLDTNLLARVTMVVNEAKARGMVVILDPHNYARYRGRIVGSGEVPNAAFANFWMQLAVQFRNDPPVWFGLMNEPHDIPSEQWLSAANAAIAAIRACGATNRILVPGNAWTGAHSWIASRNAEVMLKVMDPADNYIFEVHQYLDKDSSGTKPTAVSETIGQERLQKFTAWCRAHGKQALLGETAAADDPVSSRAMDNMLSYMEQNRDVWLGFTWWAAGPWWANTCSAWNPNVARIVRR